MPSAVVAWHTASSSLAAARWPITASSALAHSNVTPSAIGPNANQSVRFARPSNDRARVRQSTKSGYDAQHPRPFFCVPM
jgi:hypothetical protein